MPRETLYRADLVAQHAPRVCPDTAAMRSVSALAGVHAMECSRSRAPRSPVRVSSTSDAERDVGSGSTHGPRLRAQHPHARTLCARARIDRGMYSRRAPRLAPRRAVALVVVAPGVEHGGRVFGACLEDLEEAVDWDNGDQSCFSPSTWMRSVTRPAPPAVSCFRPNSARSRLPEASAPHTSRRKSGWRIHLKA